MSVCFGKSKTEPAISSDLVEERDLVSLAKQMHVPIDPDHRYWWLVEEAARSPLPKGWRKNSGVNNGQTVTASMYVSPVGEKFREHPLLEVFREMVEYYRTARKAQSFIDADEQLLHTLNEADRKMHQWKAVPDPRNKRRKIFWNQRSNETVLSDPRQLMQAQNDVRRHFVTLIKSMRKPWVKNDAFELSRRLKAKEDMAIRIMQRGLRAFHCKSRLTFSPVKEIVRTQAVERQYALEKERDRAARTIQAVVKGRLLRRRFLKLLAMLRYKRDAEKALADYQAKRGSSVAAMSAVKRTLDFGVGLAAEISLPPSSSPLTTDPVVLAEPKGSPAAIVLDNEHSNGTRLDSRSVENAVVTVSSAAIQSTDAKSASTVLPAVDMTERESQKIELAASTILGALEERRSESEAAIKATDPVTTGYSTAVLSAFSGVLPHANARVEASTNVDTPNLKGSVVSAGFPVPEAEKPVMAVPATAVVTETVAQVSVIDKTIAPKLGEFTSAVVVTVAQPNNMLAESAIGLNSEVLVSSTFAVEQCVETSVTSQSAQMDARLPPAISPASSEPKKEDVTVATSVSAQSATLQTAQVEPRVPPAIGTLTVDKIQKQDVTLSTSMAAQSVTWHSVEPRVAAAIYPVTVDKMIEEDVTVNTTANVQSLPSQSAQVEPRLAPTIVEKLEKDDVTVDTSVTAQPANPMSAQLAPLGGGIAPITLEEPNQEDVTVATFVTAEVKSLLPAAFAPVTAASFQQRDATMATSVTGRSATSQSAQVEPRGAAAIGTLTVGKLEKDVTVNTFVTDQFATLQSAQVKSGLAPAIVMRREEEDLNLATSVAAQSATWLPAQTEPLVAPGIGQVPVEKLEQADVTAIKSSTAQSVPSESAQVEPRLVPASFDKLKNDDRIVATSMTAQPATSLSAQVGPLAGAPIGHVTVDKLKQEDVHVNTSMTDQCATWLPAQVETLVAAATGPVPVHKLKQEDVALNTTVTTQSATSQSAHAEPRAAPSIVEKLNKDDGNVATSVTVQPAKPLFAQVGPLGVSAIAPNTFDKLNREDVTGATSVTAHLVSLQSAQVPRVAAVIEPVTVEKLQKDVTLNTSVTDHSAGWQSALLEPRVAPAIAPAIVVKPEKEDSTLAKSVTAQSATWQPAPVDQLVAAGIGHFTVAKLKQEDVTVNTFMTDQSTAWQTTQVEPVVTAAIRPVTVHKLREEDVTVSTSVITQSVPSQSAQVEPRVAPALVEKLKKDDGTAATTVEVQPPNPLFAQVAPLGAGSIAPHTLEKLNRDDLTGAPCVIAQSVTSQSAQVEPRGAAVIEPVTVEKFQKDVTVNRFATDQSATWQYAQVDPLVTVATVAASVTGAKPSTMQKDVTGFVDGYTDVTQAVYGSTQDRPNTESENTMSELVAKDNAVPDEQKVACVQDKSSTVPGVPECTADPVATMSVQHEQVRKKRVSSNFEIGAETRSEVVSDVKLLAIPHFSTVALVSPTGDSSVSVAERFGTIATDVVPIVTCVPVAPGVTGAANPVALATPAVLSTPSSTTQPYSAAAPVEMRASKVPPPKVKVAGMSASTLTVDETKPSVTAAAVEIAVSRESELPLVISTVSAEVDRQSQQEPEALSGAAHEPKRQKTPEPKSQAVTIDQHMNLIICQVHSTAKAIPVPQTESVRVAEKHKISTPQTQHQETLSIEPANKMSGTTAAASTASVPLVVNDVKPLFDPAKDVLSSENSVDPGLAVGVQFQSAVLSRWSPESQQRINASNQQSHVSQVVPGTIRISTDVSTVESVESPPFVGGSRNGTSINQVTAGGQVNAPPAGLVPPFSQVDPKTGVTPAILAAIAPVTPVADRFGSRATAEADIVTLPAEPLVATISLTTTDVTSRIHSNIMTGSDIPTSPCTEVGTRVVTKLEPVMQPEACAESPEVSESVNGPSEDQMEIGYDSQRRSSEKEVNDQAPLQSKVDKRVPVIRTNTQTAVQKKVLSDTATKQEKHKGHVVSSACYPSKIPHPRPSTPKILTEPEEIALLAELRKEQARRIAESQARQREAQEREQRKVRKQREREEELLKVAEAKKQRQAEILHEWLSKKADQAKKRLTVEKAIVSTIKAREEIRAQKEINRRVEYEEGRARRLELAEKLKNDLVQRSPTPPTDEETEEGNSQTCRARVVHTHIHVGDGDISPEKMRQAEISAERAARDRNKKVIYAPPVRLPHTKLTKNVLRTVATYAIGLDHVSPPR